MSAAAVRFREIPLASPTEELPLVSEDSLAPPRGRMARRDAGSRSKAQPVGADLFAGYEGPLRKGMISSGAVPS